MSYDVLTVRVAARYLRAIEFPSEQARKQYLQEHPGADPSKHTVQEHEDGGGGGKAPSQKAQSWLAGAAGEVKSFFSDPKARQEGLAKASSKLKEAPAKAGRAAVESVKKQLGEAKEAFAGIKSVMGGGSMSDSQKEAVKKVAVKVAVTVATAALVSAFPAVIAHSTVGSSVAKHVAKTVLKKVLGHASGVKLAADLEPEEWLGATLAVAVADVLSKLSEDDIREIMESAASEGESV
jgi:hypothetical protein